MIAYEQAQDSKHEFEHEFCSQSRLQLCMFTYLRMYLQVPSVAVPVDFCVTEI